MYEISKKSTFKINLIVCLRKTLEVNDLICKEYQDFGTGLFLII